ncbi:MAG: outer membrane beta-barrel protein [Flavobacteriales bacterium]|nr:outer membrane beta-barrel protein [Flavobacteriales bacterium]
MKISRIVVFLLLTTLVSRAQDAILSGNVKDGDNGQPIPGASVIVAGTTIGTATDFDGNFRLPIPKSGKVKIVCQYITHNPDTQEVTLQPGKTINLNFSLHVQVFTIAEGITIEARVNQKSENAARTAEKKSATVVTVMAAEQIAKGGDGDAASAVKRMPGATVEGGKYVYVRGLSDRYSKTTLNSAEIPGLDPNRNSVQMDLFPTNLIEKISAVKSFSPDLPGNFTGGLVNIDTKEYPNSLMMQLSTSLSYNTQSNLRNDFLSPGKGSKDWLGMDDGSRDIPAAVDGKVIPGYGADNQKLETLTKAFNKNVSPQQTNSFLNQGYSFSFGNRDSLFKRPLGYMAGVTYSHSFTGYDNGFTGRYNQTGPVSEVNNLNPDLIFKDSKMEEDVLWGGLINVSYNLAKNHDISATVLHNQNGTNIARYQEGEIPKDAVGLYQQTRAMGYKERSLDTKQLKGKHTLPFLHDLEVSWLASLTTSAQREPDLRFMTNDYELVNSGSENPDTLYGLSPSIYGPPSRYFRDMKETNNDYKVNFQLPLETKSGHPAIIKWGASQVVKDRTFREQRYDFRNTNMVYTGNMTEYFSDANMDLSSTSHVYVVDGYQERNQYDADETVRAAYTMADISLERLRIITGVRFEHDKIYVASHKASLEKGFLNNKDFLPAINTTYYIKKDTTNLRFAYSRTLARPIFRELAPFASFNFVGDYVEVGNPNLQRALIDNVDLKWETYPRTGEVISIGVFGKRFQKPIERTFNITANNPELTYRNVKEGRAYGAEFEYRRNLSAFHRSLEHFSLGTNVTLIYSRVAIDAKELADIRELDPEHPSKRVMFGQSPYVVNASLGYQNDSLGMSANLNFNVSGERMVVVIDGGDPDVFEQPTPQLDFNIRKDIGKKLAVSLNMKNILNPEFRQTQTFKGNDYVFQSYKKGMSIGLSVRYNIF